MFPKYDKKQFANVVTGDETWVHYFEPVRKVSNKIRATKHSKRPIIAKRSLSTKKVLYAIFFSGEGIAIKVPVKKGKSITGKYYKDVVLKKLKKYYQKRRPTTGFKHVRLLHDNAPAYTSAIVTAFLKKEKVTVLPHPRIPQTLPHVISFCFRNWKHSLLGGNTSPDRHLDLPFISTLLLCPNQRTVTPSRSGYIGWNFAFLATGSTSRAWNEYFWANEIWSLQIEISNSFRTSLILNGKQIWIYTVCNGRTYPGSAGLGLNVLKFWAPYSVLFGLNFAFYAVAMFHKIFSGMANSVDPDQSALGQGLHCLHVSFLSEIFVDEILGHSLYLVFSRLKFLRKQCIKHWYFCSQSCCCP